MDKDYQFFLTTDIDPYIGQWVAICNQQIVSHGNDVREVFREAKEQFPRKQPLMVRVPDKETMIF